MVDKIGAIKILETKSEASVSNSPLKMTCVTRICFSCQNFQSVEQFNYNIVMIIL